MASYGSNFHVLIIGAGTTGLLIGQGLTQAGVRCTVYERTSASTYNGRQRDWTMALHWGSQYLEKCLPPYLAADLKKTQPDPWVKLSEYQEKSLPIYNGKTGDLLADTSAATTRRASREKLRKLCATGLDIRFGKKIVGIGVKGEKVVASFEDGTEAIGDALVGCDSAKSFVRRFVTSEEAGAATALPMIVSNFSASYTAEQAMYVRNTLHPLLKCAPHPEQTTWYVIMTMDISDESDPTTWKFQHLLTEWNDKDPVPETSEARLARFKAIAANYGEPWRSAAQWVSDDTVIPLDRIAHWEKPIKWNNFGGRITIAGDAAHPMSPHRGQGLNNGLQDAAHYVDAMKSALRSPDGKPRKLSHAIDEYDAEVLERGSKEIRVSAEQAWRSTHWDEYLESPAVVYGMQKITDERARM